MADQVIRRADELPADTPDEGQVDAGSEGSEETEKYVELDGVRYTAEEIKGLKEGNLRWKDYTQGKQKLAKDRKEMEQSTSDYNSLKADNEKWQNVDATFKGLPEDKKREVEALLRGSSPVSAPSGGSDNRVMERLDRIEAKQSSQDLASDLSNVYRDVGKLSPEEEDKFLQYASAYKEQAGRQDVPMSDIAKIYQPFQEKVMEKMIAGKKKEEKDRVDAAAKTKFSTSGKGGKPRPSKVTSPDDALLAEITRVTGLKE